MLCNLNTKRYFFYCLILELVIFLIVYINRDDKISNKGFSFFNIPCIFE